MDKLRAMRVFARVADEGGCRRARAGPHTTGGDAAWWPSWKSSSVPA
ncbi:hypothetical protein PEC18_00265 [Paucibacter sp. O1-1]|nr:hypothetical protein [Paucibacter sp. O1-1]MDA3824352.1 hypothetical protein [Paucibacter sp. O1-1]